MTDSMIERVAKTMGATLIPGSRTVMAADVISKELISFMARAAIEAMREPTEKMMAVGEEATWEPSSDRPYIEHYTLKAAWQAMNDAALKELP